MSGLTHSSNPYRFLGMKLELPAFLAKLPLHIQENSQAIPQIFHEGDPIPPSKHLVVILPDAEVDVVTLPRRIRNLALADHREVLLLVKPCRAENEFLSHLNLTTIAAMVRDPRIGVHTKLILNQSLARAARQYAQPDTVFVCFRQHQVSSFFNKRNLAELLAKKTRRPVYTLEGSAEEMVNPISPILTDVVYLLLSMLSLVAFFALEIWVGQNSTGALQTIIQILVVAGEVGLIGSFANKLFRD
jgi:hypothetical protein